MPTRCTFASLEAKSHQEFAEPFIQDVDAEGRILGIEILSASKVLAPGRWLHARRPGDEGADAAE